MEIHLFPCDSCRTVTPHAEDPVPDIESATVWHCVYCGTERRPMEPGSPNQPVPKKPPRKPVLSGSREKVYA